MGDFTDDEASLCDTGSEVGFPASLQGWDTKLRDGPLGAEPEGVSFGGEAATHEHACCEIGREFGFKDIGMSEGGGVQEPYLQGGGMQECAGEGCLDTGGMSSIRRDDVNKDIGTSEGDGMNTYIGTSGDSTDVDMQEFGGASCSDIEGKDSPDVACRIKDIMEQVNEVKKMQAALPGLGPWPPWDTGTGAQRRR